MTMRRALISGVAGMCAATALLLLPATAASSAQETRPYRATCVGIPEDPFSPNVHATGSCQAMHLGREAFDVRHTAVPTGPPDANLVVTLTVLGGQGVHVAANGDELRSVYAGIAYLNLLTGRIDFELEGHFTGGTGRFEGASGTTTISGVEEGGVASFTEQGSLTY